MRCSLLLFVAFFGIHSTALGQSVEANGVIAGMQGTVVFIKTDDGQIAYAHTVRPPRSTAKPCTIDVTGTELVKNLQPGMFVQFEATLSGKRTAVGEVSALTIVTPTNLGVLTRDPVVPGEDAKTKKASAIQEKCLIVGKIARVNSETLTAVLPDEKGKSMNLSLRLAPQCTVNIAVNSLAVARIGDRIEAKGKVLQPQHFSADSIKVEHSPLGGESGKRPMPKPAEAEAAAPKADKASPTRPADQPPRKPKLEVLKIN